MAVLAGRTLRPSRLIAGRVPNGDESQKTPPLMTTGPGATQTKRLFAAREHLFTCGMPFAIAFA
jgi:hypothetical protein